MAELLIKSSLNPDYVVSVRITLRQMVIADIYLEDVLTELWEGDLMWVLEASTAARDCSGDIIEPMRAYLRSFTTIDEEINGLIDRLSEIICWDNINDDVPPRILSTYPENGAVGVSPDTVITISLRDELPSNGIDPTSFQVFVKGYDLTSLVDIEGGPFEYTLTLQPGTMWESALFEDGECRG